MNEEERRAMRRAFTNADSLRDRARRDDHATAYLIRTGNADLLPMLGLAPSPPPARRRKPKVSPTVSRRPA